MNIQARRRALFLDRDGVVNVEKNYVWRVEDFEFMPGIFELCEVARDLGFVLVVVTNQAGIGRGYYSEADFQRLTAWMLDRFRERGTEIARVYHCPYHPTAGVGEFRRESFDRKPNPGMLLRAYNDLRLDLGRSVFVGDKDSDMAAGRAAGVGHLFKLVAADAPEQSFQVRAADGRGDNPLPEPSSCGTVATVKSLYEAAGLLRLVATRDG